jgi:hypothetical protein
LAAGQDLVHVRLVPGVEQDWIARRLERPVYRDRQFDDTEIGAKVTAGLADLLDQEGPDLRRERGQLVRR